MIYCRHGFLGRRACSYLALLDSDVIDFAAAAAAAVLAVKGRPFIFTVFFFKAVLALPHLLAAFDEVADIASHRHTHPPLCSPFCRRVIACRQQVRVRGS